MTTVIEVTETRVKVVPPPADLAWLAILGGVVVFDVLATDGGTLSEAMDRYKTRHPWLVRFMVVGTAAHLIRVIPPWMDFWSLVWVFGKGVRRVRVRPVTGPS